MSRRVNISGGGGGGGSITDPLDWKESVRAATAAALPNPVVGAAGSGVGKTLTAGANAAIVVDGVALNLNDRVLVKNQVAAVDNGIYTVTVVGDGATPWELTRATDADENADVTSMMAVGVEEGTQADTIWILSTNDPIIVDVTALTFTSFGAGGALGLQANYDIVSDIALSDAQGAIAITDGATTAGFPDAAMLSLTASSGGAASQCLEITSNVAANALSVTGTVVAGFGVVNVTSPANGIAVNSNVVDDASIGFNVSSGAIGTALRRRGITYSGTDFTLEGVASVATMNINLEAGTNAGVGVGGSINLTAGDGNADDGGDIVGKGGDAGGATFDGGEVSLTGGAGQTTGAGGNAILAGGTGGGTGVTGRGGDVVANTGFPVSALTLAKLGSQSTDIAADDTATCIIGSAAGLDFLAGPGYASTDTASGRNILLSASTADSGGIQAICLVAQQGLLAGSPATVGDVSFSQSLETTDAGAGTSLTSWGTFEIGNSVQPGGGTLDPGNAFTLSDVELRSRVMDIAGATAGNVQISSIFNGLGTEGGIVLHTGDEASTPLLNPGEIALNASAEIDIDAQTGVAVDTAAGDISFTIVSGGSILGTAGPAVGSGGVVDFTAGAGVAGGGGGGAILTAGDGDGAGIGGGASLNGGAGGATGAGGTSTVAGGAGGLTSGAGGAVAISGGAASAGNSGGGAVTISTGAGSGNAAAGNLNLFPGAGGGLGGAILGLAGAGGTGGSRAGGQISFVAGSGNAGSGGPGGNINLSAGAAGVGGGGGAGGSATLGGGNSAGTNAGGDVSVLGGDGSGSAAGGDFIAEGGDGGATGAGGAVSITGGVGGATSGSGGDASVKGGDATAGNSLGGSVNIGVGAGSGTQAAGDVLITTGDDLGARFIEIQNASAANKSRIYSSGDFVMTDRVFLRDPCVNDFIMDQWVHSGVGTPVRGNFVTRGGAVELITSGGANDTSILEQPNAGWISRDGNPRAEFRVSPNTTATGEVLCSVTDPLLQHFAQFRFTAGTANWQCETDDNTGPTTTDSGVAVTATATPQHLVIVEDDDGGGNVLFYIDGTLVATHSGAANDIPGATNIRSPRIIMDNNGTAAVHTLRVHEIYFSVDHS